MRPTNELSFPSPGPRRAGALVLLFGALAAGGCYAHAPLALEAARPEQEVRVELTAAGVDRVRRLVELEGWSVTGRVAEARPDTLLVEVPAGMRRDHVHLRVIHQPVTLPREEIARLELRRLDRVRSAALAGALAAGVVAVLRMMGGEGYGEGPVQPVDPSPKSVGATLRLPFP